MREGRSHGKPEASGTRRPCHSLKQLTPWPPTSASPPAEGCAASAPPRGPSFPHTTSEDRSSKISTQRSPRRPGPPPISMGPPSSPSATRLGPTDGLGAPALGHGRPSGQPRVPRTPERSFSPQGFIRCLLCARCALGQVHGQRLTLLGLTLGTAQRMGQRTLRASGSLVPGGE